MKQFKLTFLVVALMMVLSNVGWGQYSGTGTFTKITSLTDLTDGYYVIAYGTTFAMNNTNAGSYFGNTAITPSGTTITNPATTIVWKIQTDAGARTIYNEVSSKYVSYTGSSNAAYAVNSVSGNSERWTFAWSSTVFTVNNVTSTTRLLQYNTSSPRFACYTGSQQNITLYKLASSNSTPPTLTPDATNNNVDNDIDITFTDDATWRGLITAVKIGGTALTVTTDYVITSGNIKLIPSGLNTLLTTSGTKAVTVVATGYNDATVSQIINPGTPNKLAMKTQPTAPAGNGTVLGTQPEVYIQDQYGNLTTSTANVVANVGSGTWTIGGTTTISGVNGTSSFTDLTASSISSVTGATINFTSTGLTGVTSNTFDIPAPAPFLSVSPATLTGFTYIFGNGPSASQTYTLSGSNLKSSPGNITITGSTNYEVSTDNISFAGSVLVPYSSPSLGNTTIYVRLISGLAAGTYNSEIISNAGGGATTKDVTCSGSVSSPTITLSTSTLSGFTYEFGSGPSTSQSYNISGVNLLPASGDLTITAPVDFEVSSTLSGTYSSSFTIAYTNNTLSSTPVYVRLKAGLPVATYSAEIIANTGGTATQKDVTCDGSVTTPVPAITWTGTAGDGLWSSSTNWSGNAVPVSTDRVLLDNSTVSGTYIVTLPSGAVKTTISRLTISPTTGNNITLSLPVTNTYGASNDAGLVVGDGAAGTDDIILNSGAILINSSGGSAGNGIQVLPSGSPSGNGIVRINNGGKFTHNCTRSTGGIVPFLSTSSGTELGEFEYDVATGLAISASGRFYGSLTLSKTSGIGNYSSSGSSALTIRGNFKINSGATYTTTMSGDMNVAGNIINNGSALAISTQIVNLNGTSVQNISGTGSISLGSMTLNNTAGITLSRDLTITGTLTFTNGKLTLGTSNLMLPTIAVVGANSTNYIVTDGTGYVKRTISTGTLQIPVGTATAYSPVALAEATATNDYSVRVEPDLSGDPTSRVKLKWTITRLTANTPDVTLTLGWMASEEGVVFAGNRAAYSKFFDIETGLEMGSGSYTQQFSTEPYSNTRSGINTFSPIGVGPSLGALPVNLSTLNSSVAGRNIKLNWTTASETNNSGFNVERMNVADNNWSKITFVSGHGTVNTPTNYSFEDRNLQTGKYKYRLKQIDVNGNFEYFNLNGEVEIGVPKTFNLSQNYPNPFNPVTKINFDLPTDGKVTMMVYDITGREIARLLNSEYKKAGYYTTDFNAGMLSSGVYFYSLSADNFRMTKKMVVLK